MLGAASHIGHTMLKKSSGTRYAVSSPRALPAPAPAMVSVELAASTCHN